VKYPKIQSLYKRDPATKFRTFLPEQFALPEFETLYEVPWLWKEKLDGTNIRIDAYYTGNFLVDGVTLNVIIRGRTDKADLHKDLVAWIRDRVTAETLRPILKGGSMTIFAEGVGPGIQKGGGNYGAEKHIKLFDIFDGRWWLQEEIEEVGHALSLDVAPVLWRAMPKEVEEVVAHGITSKFGDFQAEGVVGVPEGGLLRFNGDRIITKIKTKDYA